MKFEDAKRIYNNIAKIIVSGQEPSSEQIKKVQIIARVSEDRAKLILRNCQLLPHPTRVI